MTINPNKEQQLWYKGKLHMAHISDRVVAKNKVEYGTTVIDGKSYKVYKNPLIDAWEFMRPERKSYWCDEGDDSMLRFTPNQGYAGI
jgi:hypothetical protein